MAKNDKVAPKTNKDFKQKPTNGMAIAGFVCSFFFQILGLIFSIIGLCQIKNSGENGRGLAIAGIIISSVVTFFTILITIMAIVFGFMAADRAIDYMPEEGCSYEFIYNESKNGHSIEYNCD